MARVQVPKAVFEGITAVRDSGLTNMLSVPDVIRLARRMGFEEAARWVEAHRKEYAHYVQLRIMGVIYSLHLCLLPLHIQARFGHEVKSVRSIMRVTGRWASPVGTPTKTDYKERSHARSSASVCHEGKP